MSKDTYEKHNLAYNYPDIVKEYLEEIKHHNVWEIRKTLEVIN